MQWYDDNAINTFTKLVNLLKKQYNILFVLVPYNPKVWNFKELPILKAMEIVEFKVHELAKNLKVNVVGSYNAQKIGCREDEFHDAMHPKSSCLVKLESVMKLY